jgi:hypothetical protein
VTETAPALADGRQVSLLPCSGGISQAGTVVSWMTERGHVMARVAAAADVVAGLDHHQVWLSTTERHGDEPGVTIFLGRAVASDPQTLALDGAVRLTAETRRKEVRAGGASVTLPPSGGSSQTVETLDISRSGVRVPLTRHSWVHDDPVDLVVQAGPVGPFNVTAHLLRLDPGSDSAVLLFDDLSESEGAALDRYALAQLPAPQQPA